MIAEPDCPGVVTFPADNVLENAVARYTTIAAVLTMGLVLAGPEAAAEVYKWVDEDGVTHYSQTPPDSDQADRVEVDAPKPPDDEIDRAQEELEAVAKENEERRKERKKGEKEAAEEAEKQAYLEKRCAELRSSLEELKNNRRILTSEGEDGTRRMSEEERRKRVAERRKQIDKECN